MADSTAAASLSDSPVDQIANILAGEPEKKEDELTQPEDEVVEDEDGLEVEGEDEDVDEDEDEDPEEQDAPDNDVTWASALGIDEGQLVLDDDGNFQAVKVKVDGEESTVDLNTLVAGYQSARSTTQRSQALAEQRKQLEQESTQAREKFKTRLDEAEQYAGVLQKKLLSDYQGIDWHKLRMENPAEYSATMADFQNRKTDIERMTTEIKQNQEAVETHKTQEFQTKQAEYVQEQASRTLELFPEWKDPAVAKVAFEEMQTFAKRFGYEPDEFNQLMDSRAISIIQSAMKAEKNTQAAEKKATKPVPKFRKSTKSRQAKPKTTKLDRLVKTAKTAKGATKRKAQTDAVAELLMSGE